jgi:hypothetical protein
MLQFSDGAIQEVRNPSIAVTAFGDTAGNYTLGHVSPVTSSAVQYTWPYTTYWQSYPVYICTDKTAKAIEVLKCLQAEKLLKCDSVPRFIQLVEKIAGLL